MKITHTLIEKFLDNRCSAAEGKVVARHLKKHPECMALYMKFSWDAGGKEKALPPGYAEEMYRSVNKMFTKHTRIVRFQWLAAACSLLMVATGVWLFSAVKKNPIQTLIITEKQMAAQVQWSVQVNTHSTASVIRLADGSVVKLAPQAVIKYRETFGGKGPRNIYLEGQADFEVAHDTMRPFTVYTRSFSTTALGTSFSVSQTMMACTVKLFRGKVLVKGLLNTLRGWHKDMILFPGAEMRYSYEEGRLTMIHFKEVNDQHPGALNRAIAGKYESILFFNNTALIKVMKILSERYRSSISYNEELLKEKYFTGEVRKKDSLSVLLKVITNMNGLQVIKIDNTYFIK